MVQNFFLNKVPRISQMAQDFLHRARRLLMWRSAAYIWYASKTYQKQRRSVQKRQAILAATTMLVLLATPTRTQIITSNFIFVYLWLIYNFFITMGGI